MEVSNFSCNKHNLLAESHGPAGTTACHLASMHQISFCRGGSPQQPSSGKQCLFRGPFAALKANTSCLMGKEAFLNTSISHSRPWRSGFSWRA